MSDNTKKLRDLLNALRDKYENAIEKDGASIRHMSVKPAELLAMDDDQADTIFREKLEDELNVLIPDGVTATLHVDKGTAKKFAAQAAYKEKRPLDATPQPIRDWFEADVANRLASVEADLVSVDWDFQYAPLVTWHIRGNDFSACFYLDGTYQSSKDLRVKNEDMYKHTIESIAMNSERFAYNG